MRRVYTYLAIGSGIVVVLGIVLFFVLNRSHGTSKAGLIKIKDYVHVKPGGINCHAIIPQCGECYGKVIDEECYATQAEFDEFKSYYPSLQAE
jgi:hypothetical protein